MNENYILAEQNRIIKWRNLIIKVNVAACLTLFLVEIGMFFMIKNDFTSERAMIKHIREYIVTPMSISIITTLICIFFEHWEQGHRTPEHLLVTRNLVPILVNWGIIFVIAYYHYIFVMTMLLFGLTLLLTVFFLERRITILITCLSYFSVIVSGLYSKRVTENAYLHEYFVINLAIAFLFITFIGCLCIFLINLIKNKNENMEHLVATARNANLAKTNFLTNMGIEVRTPINAIIGMNEVILRESRDKNTIECANDIDAAANSLLALINEMLDMAVIETGKLEIHPEEYSVEQLVYASVHFVQKRALLKRLKLNTDISPELPVRLIGDDKRMLQVITVLLENAVKYTSDGSVTLKFDGFTRGEDYVLQVSIADTGTGLRQEEIDDIFLSFERLGLDRNDNIDGTGFGLAICNRLLAMMDSRMSVLSEVGKGTTFSFKITQKIADASPMGEFVYRDNTTTKTKNVDINIFAPRARVLVVDDNDVNLKVFKGLLLPSAMNIDEATSGPEAIKLCSENDYDLVFLDHLMPGMDGVETLHHIREDADSINRMVPIVMLTANASSGAREEFLKEGFDDFLTKPVATTTLVNIINDLIDPNLIEVRPDDYQLQTDDDLDDIILPNIQGVDWEKGITNCGTKKLLLDTIKQFCNVMDDEISYLDKTVTYDREKYRIKVHAIKSVAATIGNDTVCVLARLLEFAARDGKTDVIDRLHAVLIAEMKSYKAQVENLMPEQEVKDEGDPKIIALEINNIKSAMIEFDTDRADEAIERINQYTYADSLQKYVNKLTDAITNLDADTAVEICDILIARLFKTGESEG